MSNDLFTRHVLLDWLRIARKDFYDFSLFLTVKDINIQLFSSPARILTSPDSDNKEVDDCERPRPVQAEHDGWSYTGTIHPCRSAMSEMLPRFTEQVEFRSAITENISLMICTPPKSTTLCKINSSDYFLELSYEEDHITSEMDLSIILFESLKLIDNRRIASIELVQFPVIIFGNIRVVVQKRGDVVDLKLYNLYGSICGKVLGIRFHDEIRTASPSEYLTTIHEEDESSVTPLPLSSAGLTPHGNKENVFNFNSTSGNIPEKIMEGDVVQCLVELGYLPDVWTPDETFAQMGVDSLKAAELEFFLQTRLPHLDIPVAATFLYPSVNELEAFLDTLRPPPPAEPIVEKLIPTIPLTPIQTRMIFLNTMEPEARSQYNEPSVSKMKNFNKEMYHKAVHLLIMRYTITRTAYNPREQFLLSGTECYQIMETITTSVEEYTKRPIDVLNDPCFFFGYIPSTSDETIVSVVWHHIAVDGQSYGILSKELFLTLYYKRQLPPLSSLQYHQYAMSLEEKNYDKELEFWRSHYKKNESSVILTDRPRKSTQNYSGAQYVKKLPASTTNTLKSLRKTTGASDFAIMTALYKLLIYKMEDVSDLPIGFPFSLRTLETFYTVGCFVNTVPLSIEVDGNTSICDYIKLFNSTITEVKKNAHVPFDVLVKELGERQIEPSLSPLFQICLIMDNINIECLGDTELLDSYSGVAKFEQTWSFQNNGTSWSIIVDYRTALYNKERIVEYVDKFLYLLNLIGNIDVNKKISEISVTTKNERHSIDIGRQINVEDYPRQGPVEMFTENLDTAAQLFFREEPISYIDMDARSSAEANHITENYLQHYGEVPTRDRTVLLINQKNHDLMIAIYAIWKAGFVVVPVDDDWTVERTLDLSQLFKNPLILSNKDFEASSALLENYFPVVRMLTETKPLPRKTFPFNFNLDMSYITCSSGTTGKPKAICSTFEGFSNLAKSYTRAMYVNNSAHFYQVVNFAFDVFFGDLLMCFANGSSMTISEHKLPDPSEMIPCSHAYIMPAFLSVLSTSQINELTKLTCIVFGGDYVQPAVIQKFLKTEVLLYQQYGLTEQTVFSTAHRMKNLTHRAAVGQPFKNTAFILRDRDGQLLPENGRGKCYLNGIGITRGFYSNAEETQKKIQFREFGKEVATGDIIDGIWGYSFVGRVDLQLKIRGKIVNLKDIEDVICKYPSVSGCAVVVHNHRLVAHVIWRKADTENKNNNPATALLEELAKQLPEFMVPSYVIPHESFPVNANGKVNRTALPKPTAVSHSATSIDRHAKTPTEISICRIFSKYVGNVFATQCFFDAGGDSVKAMLTVQDLADIGLKIDLRNFFKLRTAEKIAEFIDAPKENVAEKKVEPVKRLIPKYNATATDRHAKTPTEITVCKVFSKYVGNVFATQCFFDAGGDSEEALLVVQDLADGGLKIDSKTFFKLRTPEKIAEFIDAPGETVERKVEPMKKLSHKPTKKAGSAPSSDPIMREYEGQLNHLQKRLWFLERMDPTNDSYIIPIIFRMEGNLDERKLWTAVNKLIINNFAMRTYINQKGIRFLLSGTECHYALRASDDIQNPSIIEVGEVLNVHLKTTSSGHEFYFYVHHIACDGRSMAVMSAQLAAFYNGEEISSTNNFQPSTPIDDDLAFWKGYLDGFQPLVHTSPNKPEFEYTNQAAYVHEYINLPKETEAFMKKHVCSLYHILVAAYITTLQELYEHNDVTIGTNVANRNSANMNEVGMFANTIPLRFEHKFRKVSQAMEQAKEQILAAIDHHGSSLADILRTTIEGGVTAFDFVLNMQNLSLAELIPLEGLKCEVINPPSKYSQFLQTWLFLQDDEVLRLELQYDKSKIHERDILTTIEVFKRVFNGMIINDSMSIPKPIFTTDSNEEKTEVASVSTIASSPAPEITAEENLVTPGAFVVSIVTKHFQDLLKREDLNEETNFFTAGGHSLLAVQLIDRLSDTFNIDIPLQTIYKNPTIRQISVWIEANQPETEKNDENDSAGTNRSIIESVVIQNYEEVLERNDVTLDTHFFHAGGHSLLVVEVIDQLQEFFHIDIPLMVLFKNPEAKHIVEYIFNNLPENKDKVKNPPSTSFSAPILAEVHPNPLQVSLFRYFRSTSVQHMYSMKISIDLKNTIDQQKFTTAIRSLSMIHLALRTCFVKDGKKYHCEVWSGTEAYLDIHTEEPLFVDVFEKPTFNVKIDGHVDIEVSHATVDGNALELIVQSIDKLLETENNIFPPDNYPAFNEFLIQKFEESSNDTINYWKSLLSDYQYNQLTTDYPRKLIQNHGSSTKDYPMDTTLSQANQLAQSAGTTPFAVLLAALSNALSTHSHHPNMPITIGFPFNLRNSASANTVAMGIVTSMSYLRPTGIASSDIRTITIQTAEAMTYPYITFEDLSDLSPSGKLFGTMFTFDSYSVDENEHFVVRGNHEEFNKFEISMFADPVKRTMRVQFDNSLYLPSRIDRIVDTLKLVVEQWSQNVEYQRKTDVSPLVVCLDNVIYDLDDINKITSGVTTKVEIHDNDIILFYEEETSDLSADLEKKTQELPPAIRPTGYQKIPLTNPDYFDLSRQELQMFFFSMMGDDYYELPFLKNLSLDPDPHSFKKVLPFFLQKHEALRTEFFYADGNPVKRVLSITEAYYGFDVDFSAAAKDVIKRRAQISLEDGPPYKITIIKQDNHEYVLLRLHHIISDAYSTSIMDKELNELTHKISSGQKVEVQRSKFSYARNYQWIDNPIEDEDNYVSSLTLPTFQCKIKDSNSYRQMFKVPISVIEILTRHYSVSPYVLFTQACTAALCDFFGCESINIGLPFSNRTGETKDLFGYVLNTLVLHIENGPMEQGNLKQIQNHLSLVIKNNIFYGDLVAKVRNKSKSATKELFHVYLNCRYDLEADDDETDYTYDLLPLKVAFPIEVDVDKFRNHYEVTWRVNTSNINDQQLTTLLQHMQQTLIMNLDGKPVNEEHTKPMLQKIPNSELAYNIENILRKPGSPPVEQTPQYSEASSDVHVKTIVKLASECIKSSRVTERDNFFTAGGNSLQAILFAEKIEDEFGITVNMEDIYNMVNFQQFMEKLGLHNEANSTSFSAMDLDNTSAKTTTDKYTWCNEPPIRCKVDTSEYPSCSYAPLLSNYLSYHKGNFLTTPGQTTIPYEDSYLKVHSNAHQIRNSFASQTGELIRADTIIPVISTKSASTILFCLSVIAAGAAYLPIDVAFPKARIQVLLEESHAKVYVGDKQDDINIPHLAIDPESVISFRKLYHMNAPEDIAYVIFTSGTTGRPKGVCAKHSSVANLAMACTQDFFMRPNDVVYQFTNFVFDNSVLEVVMAVANGATLLVEQQMFYPRRFVKLLEEHRITHCLLFPGIISVFEPDAFAKLNQLRYWVVGAEKLPPKMLSDAIRESINVVQNYGPTETTAYALTKLMKRLDNAQNLGKPIRNAQVRLKEGSTGELMIRGAGRMRGYLNRSNCFTLLDEELWYASGDTVQILPNNDVIFIGRTDNQVKIRGFRTELGEIEASILQLPSISQCRVFWKSEAEMLVAYCVADQAVDQEVVDHCKKKLLPHMVPTNVVCLKKFPLTPNSKLDVTRLPDPSDTNKSWVTKLAEEILQCKVNDSGSFLSSGGTIKQAYQLVQLAKEKKNINLDINAILSGALMKDLPTMLSVSPQALVIKDTHQEDTIRLQLRKIWADLLQHEDFTDDDHFFFVRGHSILLLQLRQNVNAHFKANFSVPELIGALIFSDMVKLLLNSGVEVKQEVAIEQPPTESFRIVDVISNMPTATHTLVFIHPLYGGSAAYSHLISELCKTKKFHIISISHPNSFAQKTSDLRFADSLPKLAEIYIEAIKHTVHGSPIFIGASLGGIIAFEMAKSITGSVVAIDSGSDFRALENYSIQQHKQQLEERTAEYQLDEKTLMAMLQNSWDLLQMVVEYSPSRSTTPFHILSIDGSDMGWNRYCSPVLHQINGTHDNMLDPGHVEHIANIIQKIAQGTNI